MRDIACHNSTAKITYLLGSQVPALVARNYLGVLICQNAFIYGSMNPELKIHL
jgi:hypothetical protein